MAPKRLHDLPFSTVNNYYLLAMELHQSSMAKVVFVVQDSHKSELPKL